MWVVESYRVGESWPLSRNRRRRNARAWWAASRAASAAASGAEPGACSVGHIRPPRFVPVWHVLRTRPRSVRLSAGGVDPSGRVHRRPRGQVRAWSRRSRMRLMERISMAVWSGSYALVTLTYPGEYERSPDEWKRHLHAFRRRWERKYGKSAAAWVMEFQRRGACHFHLALQVPEGADMAEIQAFTSLAWYEIVASGDPRHLLAGTQVKPVTDIGGVGRYLVGEIGKAQQKVLPTYAEQTGAGRWWGVWRLPTEDVEVSLTVSEYQRVRRVLRALASRKGYAFRPRTAHQGLMVFDDARVAWRLATQLAGWLATSRAASLPSRVRLSAP